MRIASFFSGAGGLDLGFENVGFKLAYANDNWSGCWETFERNHNHSIDKRSITEVKSSEVPEVDGFVGGPPCQSWSLAGAMRGIEDPRGKLFYEYLRLLKDKKPLFFLAENVAGILSSTHLADFKKIIEEFEKIGYNVSYELLNSKDFGVPQERKRVIVIGYRKDINKKFDFTKLKKLKNVTLKEAIGDLPESTEGVNKNKPNLDLEIPNHEHIVREFNSMFMSRNRRKNWDEASFTIQAGARHAPLHPSSPKMIKVAKDIMLFETGPNKPRRLSIRECARIQTFPDNFIFYYNILDNGYKMIGNAVPVKFAEVIAKQIKRDIAESIKD